MEERLCWTGDDFVSNGKPQASDSTEVLEVRLE